MFAIVVIISIPFYFVVFSFKIGGNKMALYGHSITRMASHILYFFLGIRVVVKGKELIDKNQVYVFVANHNALVDVPAMVMAVPITFKYLAKYELTKIPLFGYIINNLYFSVKREDKGDRAKSMDAMKKCLDSGISLFIYPEGTRNKTNETLAPFYDGAFRLSLASGKPIGICSIRNAKKILNKNEMQPGTLECIFSKPIFPASNDDIESLKEKVRVALLRNL